jgi:hypothetical protein
MRRTRRFFALGLVLALSAGVSCTTSDGPTGVPLSLPVEQPSYSLEGDGLAGDGLIDTVLGVTDLLTCTEQKYEVREETIGREGGEIKVGRHVLKIPKGALSKTVRIKAEQIRGRTNSVRFSPEGLRFAKPARLTLSYRNCASIRPPKRVAYTNELLRILELPFSQDYPKYEYVTGAIDHFSRYAVAY